MHRFPTSRNHWHIKMHSKWFSLSMLIFFKYIYMQLHNKNTDASSCEFFFLFLSNTQSEIKHARAFGTHAMRAKCAQNQVASLRESQKHRALTSGVEKERKRAERVFLSFFLFLSVFFFLPLFFFNLTSSHRNASPPRSRAHPFSSFSSLLLLFLSYCASALVFSLPARVLPEGHLPPLPSAAKISWRSRRGVGGNGKCKACSRTGGGEN